MAIRPNSRNWPIWVVAVATAWFVAITFAWALRPLTDHVPITVAHVAVAGDGTGPGARDQGPTIDVRCGTPAGGNAFTADGLPDLAALRDNAGKPLLDPQFARTPCTSFHRQSHLLWYSNVGLFVVIVGLVAWVVRRRLLGQRQSIAPSSTPVGV